MSSETPSLQAALDAAVESFVARNPKSQALHEQAVKTFPGGNTRTVLHTSPFPVCMKSGKDFRVVSEDGDTYTDLTAEFTAGLYGHSNPEILAALQHVIQNVGLNVGATTAQEQLFSRALCDRFGLERIRLTNSGTEANLHALAAAKLYTKKSKVVAFGGGYHGAVFGFKDGEVAANNVDKADWIVAKYNDLESAVKAIKSDGVAAVILEAMQGSGGCICGTMEFLTGVEKAAKEAGVIFIVDEVMTSRISGAGLSAVHGLRPDMKTFGKYLGGGVAFGAFGGREDIMAVYDPRVKGSVAHSGTFNNNTFVTHCGYAGLTKVYPPEVAEAFTKTGDGLLARLNEVSKGTKLCFTGIGSVATSHFVAHGPRSISDALDVTEINDLKDLFWFHLLENGFWVTRRGFYALVLGTPQSELDRFVAVVHGFLTKYAALVARLGDGTANAHLHSLDKRVDRFPFSTQQLRFSLLRPNPHPQIFPSASFELSPCSLFREVTMDSQNVSDVPSFRDLMEKAKAVHLRSKKEEGKKVSFYPSRDDIIAEFLQLLFSTERGKLNFPARVCTNLPAPYAPCVRSSDELEPIFISDMTMETHHRGRKIFLRVCTPVCRMSGLMMVTEDEHETAIRLQLYHQPDEELIPVAQLFKLGTVLLLKDPWFKRSVDGKYALRVDHVSDLIRLHGEDERIPFKWRPRLVEIDSTKSRLAGNKHFKSNEWGSALQQYTEAIEVAENPGDAQLAYVNRALVNLRLGRPEEAFNDAVAMNSKLQPTEKGLFREALCLYKLQKFDQCLSKLRELLSLHPNNNEAPDEIKKVINRLRECNDGIYDWQDMHRQTKNTPPLIDCGTFSRNVEVRESPGKGRGLFTTKAVTAGELLLCEKAFAYSHDEEGIERTRTVLLDFHTMSAFKGSQAKTLTQIVQKIYHAPETALAFLDLHHGEYSAPPGVLHADSMPVVDTFLASSIISINSFGASRSTFGKLRRVLLPEQLSRAQISEDAQAISTNGIWCIASYVNHSCVPNCNRAFIGDMMIIRATEDLPAGAELIFHYLDVGATESYEESQKKLSHWKFSCACYLCKMKKKTPVADMRQRQAHLQSLEELLARPVPVNMDRARSLLKQIDKTYKKSGQANLKLTLQSGYYFLAQALHDCGNLVETTSMLLRVLELGGFILASPAGNARQNPAVIEIRKWGAPCTEYSYHAIMQLHSLCVESAVSPFTHDQLSGIMTMKTYAETAYSIFVGEKETYITVMVKALGIQ